MLQSYVLEFRCQSCKKPSKLNANKITRGDLESDYGTLFNAKCNQCLATAEYHVNDVKAVPNKSLSMVLILLAIAAILTLTLLLLGIGWMSTTTFAIPVVFYLIYSNSVDQAVSRFNSILVSRERNYQPKNKKTFN